MSDQMQQTAAVRRMTIGEDRAGQRLDNFLMVSLKGVPKSKVYKIIRSGEVRVNGGRVKQTYRLQSGDEVRIPPVRVAPKGAAPAVSDELASRLRASILYEDEGLLVLNKPAGLAVHGGSGIQLGLIETLRALFPEQPGLELVHRLDRDTSGCIMVAKKRSSLRKVQQLMREGKIEKRYRLLCCGFKGRTRFIDAPLIKTMRGSERVVRVSRDGKSADTTFTLIKKMGEVALVDARLGTGRTHQIRVHAQYGGFPLLGDDKYGMPDMNDYLVENGLNRLFLHAHSLCFRHPVTGQELRVEAPLDKLFLSGIRHFEKVYGAGPS